MTKNIMMAAAMTLALVASVAAQDKAPRAQQTPRPNTYRVEAPPPPPPPGMPRIPMAWWKDSHLAQELNLTDAQKAKLEQTFTDYRLKLIDLRATLEKEETRLQPMIEADRLDEGQISSQLDKVVAARGQLEKTSALMTVDMRKQLTQDQWKKLRAMEPQMRGPHPPGGEDDMMGMVPRPPGRPPKALTPPDGPNNTDGKGRPTEEQPR